MKNGTKLTGLILLLLGMLSIAFLPLSEGQAPATLDADAIAPIPYDEATSATTLNSTKLRECSGMATSLANSAILWTHNDSGHKPQLHAFNFEGSELAIVSITGAGCIDWEDMTAITWKDKPYLVVADVGDNQKRRKEYQLYLVPDTTVPDKELPKKIEVERTIRFMYDGGPHDCESVGFDTESQTFILISKAWSPYCDAFELKMPADEDTQTQTAKKIGRLKLAGFTALDISPDSYHAIGLTYADAYQFTRCDNESWAEAFRKKPHQIALPARKQGESICYGPDGKTIYTTSEGENPPLITIPPRAD